MAHRAPVILVPYTPSWRERFHEERRILAEVLPQHFVIEHIGSTAVVGLAAKPIIDIMIGANSLAEIEQVIPALERLGYEYLPQNEAAIPERRFLAKPIVRPRHFHLHCVVLGGKFWREHLAFRDRLRADPALAQEYEALKLRLAQQFGDDRAGYTDAKSDFILEVVKQAMRRFSNP